MGVLIMIAGAALAALGGYVYKISVSAMHETTAAILFGSGLACFALGFLGHTVETFFVEYRAQITRKRAESGDFDQSWKSK